MIPLVKIALNELTVRVLKWVEYEYSASNTDKPTRKINVSADTLCRKVALYKTTTLLSYKKTRVRFVAKIYDHIHQYGI